VQDIAINWSQGCGKAGGQFDQANAVDNYSFRAIHGLTEYKDMKVLALNFEV
jgi:hypothetical protein